MKSVFLFSGKVFKNSLILIFIFTLIYLNSAAQVTVQGGGKVGIRTIGTISNSFQIGNYVGYNSYPASFTGDVRLPRYSSSFGVAFLQARDGSGSNSIGLVIRTQNNGGIVNAMELLSNGNCGIGRSPSYKLDVNGTLRVQNTVYTSDLRLKDSINSISDAKLKLSQIRGVTYNLKPIQMANDTAHSDADFSISKKKKIGFIAQELKEVLPDLVYEDNEGYLAIDYIGIIPMLVEALKEQENEIEILKKHINGESVKKSTTIGAGYETKAEFPKSKPNSFNKINNEDSSYISVYDGDYNSLIPDLVMQIEEQEHKYEELQAKYEELINQISVLQANMK